VLIAVAALAQAVSSGGTASSSGHQTLPSAAFSTRSMLQIHETPSGTPNGILSTFTLTNVPATGTLMLAVDGMQQKLNADYTLASQAILFSASSIPPPTAKLDADYTISGTSTGVFNLVAGQQGARGPTGPTGMMGPAGVGLPGATGATGTLVQYFGTNAPTSGFWGLGATVINTTAGPLTPISWSCVATGTPGTWEANYPGDTWGAAIGVGTTCIGPCSGGGDVGCPFGYQCIASSCCPSTTTSTVIRVSNPIHFISPGAAAPKTLAVPPYFATSSGGWVRPITLIPLSGMTFASGGNLPSSTLISNTPYILFYDPTSTLWWMK
jgi:hypothetical protein